MIYHQLVQKSKKEILETAREIKKKRQLKEERKKEQEENIKKKQEELGINRWDLGLYRRCNNI